MSCDDDVLQSLRGCMELLQGNNSKAAVDASAKLFEKHQQCPQSYETYAICLFRSGDWFKGIEILECGIEKFGALPYLIKAKADFSIEMAELGTGKKNIDGNSVYKANAMPYNDEQFRNENLNAALSDLEYLFNSFHENEDAFYIGRVYQLVKNFDESTKYFGYLRNDDNYRASALFFTADNFIAQHQYEKAEATISELLKDLPKQPQLYRKLSKIYKLRNEQAKETGATQQAVFYENVPEFTDLSFSKDNYDLLLFFGSSENKPDQKIRRLKEISKAGDVQFTVDVCLMILQMHANHDNGVEEEAADILSAIGDPAIDKIHKMFQSDVSTCSITKLADVMTTVKNEKSWSLMVEYLPYIAEMPSTLIPPSVPEKLIKFDEDKGVKEILLVVRPLLAESSDDIMEGFSYYVYYYPLKKVPKSKLKKVAGEIGYSESEFRKLTSKLN